jgi:hypothetical protein
VVAFPLTYSSSVQQLPTENFTSSPSLSSNQETKAEPELQRDWPKSKPRLRVLGYMFSVQTSTVWEVGPFLVDVCAFFWCQCLPFLCLLCLPVILGKICLHSKQGKRWKQAGRTGFCPLGRGRGRGLGCHPRLPPSPTSASLAQESCS